MTKPQTFAPGLRIEVRDAEWRIRKVDLACDGGHLLTCEGLSEPVRGRESVFWTELEDHVRVLDPAETQLVHDTSAGYGAGLLYLDTVLRKSPHTVERLAVAQ